MNQGDQRIPVLNIIGPVGIGKSSAADAVSQLLEYEYILPHAVVDLDHVRRVYPESKQDPFNMELGFKNLVAVWKNYRSAGAQYLIIPSVMESREHLDKIRTSIPGADIFVVRLSAPLEVNHDRIRGREKNIDSLHWHLQRSTQLAKELSEKQLEHVIVETEGKQPLDIGREIICKWGVTSIREL